MTIQVLVTTMHQQDHSLLDKMNIQSDVIVGNQCDRDQVEHFLYHDHKASYYSFAEKGVGLNRNNVLMRAVGDVCLFADDDVIFMDGYVKTAEQVFDRLPQADVVIFNWPEGQSAHSDCMKDKRLNFSNYFRYGTARMAIRLDRVREKGILFNLSFGGGTPHRHGEDTLFLHDCYRQGLKIYAVPEYISSLDPASVSTWNIGYDETYLKDQGCLYRAMSRRWWRLLCIQDAIRKRKKYGMSWLKAYRTML